MNTALGNCLLMSSMVWAYCSSIGATARLANNGDDCVVIMSRSHLHRFSEGLTPYFLSKGFTLVVEAPVDVFERISFCQTNPVWTGTRYIMVRNPDMGLAKDCTFKTPDMGRAVESFRRWSYQVGVAGLSLAGEVPIYSAAYAALKRIGTPCKKAQGFGNMSSGFEYMAHGMRSREHVTQAARESFHRAFGVLPSEQMSLEARFADLYKPTEAIPVMFPLHHRGITLDPQITVEDWYHHD